ncbi:MAG: 2-amino-4-hydroxy-6-hydroxymethyldihydropteridine diphosphokinase [Acidobacteriota bacterium]
MRQGSQQSAISNQQSGIRNSKQQTANSKQQNTIQINNPFYGSCCSPFHSILTAAILADCIADCCLLFAVYRFLSVLMNAYIGLGSNLGDRAGNLLLAVRSMIDLGLEVGRLSRIYETEPFETFSQPAYLNMVAEMRSSIMPGPEKVMARLLRVEHSLGRTREITGGPRSIDLDLLLYSNETRDSELLKLPHPRFHRRRFVLAPLAELAPLLVHPTLNRTVSELLASLDDASEVKVWTP